MSTTNRDFDPEVQILAAISATLRADYQSGDNPWAGSPFEWIKSQPSRRVGAVGEKLVAGWLAARGFNVSRTGDSDADRVVETKRVEIKFSTLWSDHPIYKFQQLRDQEYDLVICLGVSPFTAHCWAIDKSSILTAWHDKSNREIIGQHARGEETAWIEVAPSSPGPWISGFGGSMREGLICISEMTGFSPCVDD